MAKKLIWGQFWTQFCLGWHKMANFSAFLKNIADFFVVFSFTSDPVVMTNARAVKATCPYNYRYVFLLFVLF
jgi:hypothetical protein